jgi:hypothetical protein
MVGPPAGVVPVTGAEQPAHVVQEGADHEGSVGAVALCFRSSL